MPSQSPPPSESVLPTHELINEPGVIVAHHGIAVLVRFERGGELSVRVKRKSGHVVGDRVEVSGERLVRLERRTEVRRRDAKGRVHVVAANLDTLGIVVAPEPLQPPGFIDRAAIAAVEVGMSPLLVVNKADLEGGSAFIKNLEEIHGRQMRILTVSAQTGEGMDRLMDYFEVGRRGLFVGMSGVGKSSLLNQLCPEIDLRVGGLHEISGQGTHTTTVATLHSLPKGGELVDTPGFRDFGLVDISSETLATTFFNVGADRLPPCKFTNCRHRSEPECPVLEAIEFGDLSPERYDTYLQLLLEIEAEEEAAWQRKTKTKPRPRK